MAKIKLIPGAASDLMSSAPVAGLLAKLAGEVLGRAQATAPKRSGRYQSSLFVTTGQHGDRKVSIVGSNDPKALAVESRTGNLAKALGSR